MSADFGISSWNSAQATLQRIDKLLQLSNQCSTARKFPEWHQTLTSVHRELYPFLNVEERQRASDSETEAQRKTNAYNGVLRLRNPDQRNHETGLKGFEAYKAIDSFEKLLRDLMQKHGLLMSELENPSVAMLK